MITYITFSWISDLPIEEQPPLALISVADWTATIYDYIRSTLEENFKNIWGMDFFNAPVLFWT